MDPIYQIAQRFVRFESVNAPNARSADPADPLQLQVVVTPSNNINAVIETAIMEPATRERLWRAGVGHWIFKLNPALYQTGIGYTVHYRYTMTPNAVQVTRQNFVWEPVPEVPHAPSNCIVYGTLMDGAGLPVSGGTFVIERYADLVSLTKRLSAVDVLTDPFGNWAVELPRDSAIRVVFGHDIDMRIVPSSLNRVNYTDLAIYQPAESVRKDRYGYPYPS